MFFLANGTYFGSVHGFSTPAASGVFTPNPALLVLGILGLAAGPTNVPQSYPRLEEGATF